MISIQELTFQGMELMAATYLTFEIWLTVAALYFLLTYSCSVLARGLERKMRYVFYLCKRLFPKGLLVIGHGCFDRNNFV